MASLFQAVERVNGSVLWANMHLLFWLSLVPFATAWLGESGVATPPVALYGVILVMAAVAYTILVRALIQVHGQDSPLAQAIGRDIKGRLSLVLYAAALVVAFWFPVASLALFVLVAIIWFVPDRRFERSVP